VQRRDDRPQRHVDPGIARTDLGRHHARWLISLISELRRMPAPAP
jgi:hypothetical protein